MKDNYLKKFKLKELLELEKASSIVCMKYENSSRMYDGSISNEHLYEKFKKYNDFHSDVVLAIENIIDSEISNKND